MGISRGRTFQAKGTSTKALKQKYAMLRVTCKETRGNWDHIGEKWKIRVMKITLNERLVMKLVRNCHILSVLLSWNIMTAEKWCGAWVKNGVNMANSGLPWLSRGEESVLPLQRVQIQSVIRELWSSMLYSVAKRKKKSKTKNTMGSLGPEYSCRTSTWCPRIAWYMENQTSGVISIECWKLRRHTGGGVFSLYLLKIMLLGKDFKTIRLLLWKLKRALPLLSW